MRGFAALFIFLVLVASVTAQTSEELEAQALEVAGIANNLNLTTEYDNLVKPLLPFTGELLIPDVNASVKATIMPSYEVRVNDERKPDVTVKINSSGYEALYAAALSNETQVLTVFNEAGVVVIPKSVKSEIAINLVRKYTPLEFEVEKEKGVMAVIRSAISSVVTFVVSIFAGLLGFGK